MLAWVQNPVPLSELNSFAPLQCSVPQVNQSICDGIPANEQGLVEECDFSDFPFYTCVSPEERFLERFEYLVSDGVIVWLSHGGALSRQSKPGAGHF
jgi:hypothetical protein